MVVVVMAVAMADGRVVVIGVVIVFFEVGYIILL